MSPDSSELSVIVPAYNEERRIGSSLEATCAYLGTLDIRSEIVVVDDGSIDRTAEIARGFDTPDLPVRVLTLDVNQGKGAAVRAGALHAIGTYILMTDADLSAPITEVDLLLPALSQGRADIVIGSRGLPESRLGIRQPWLRERMGRTFNLLVRAVTGLPLMDTQCGFKMFTREAAGHVFPRQRIRGFGFDVEVLYIAHRAGYRILEQPIAWNDSPGSKVHPVRDSLLTFLDLVRIRVWDWRGLYRQPEGA